MKYKFLLLFILAASQAQIAAQSKKYFLHCIFLDQKENRDFKKTFYQKNHTDSLAAKDELEKYVQTIQSQAFWQAEIKRVQYQNDSLTAYIKLGKRYFWKVLHKGNLEGDIISQVGFKPKYFKQTPFIYQEWLDLKDKILDFSESKGLPFASVKLDSIQIEDNLVSAVINYQPGAKMVFDSLIVEGNIKIRKKFLSRLLNLKNGDTFDQHKVENIPRVLRQLPYLRLKEIPTVTFNHTLANVKLNIDRKKSNQIDGILGIFPNETSGNTLITGELNLDLKNLFNSGKNLQVKWQRLQSQSQLLDMNYLHPVVLGSNFDFSFNFYLLRQDSSFLNREIGASLWYNLYESGRLSLNINSKRSTLGSENLFREFNNLPEVSEINFFSYGIGYQWNNLDDVFYPSKGANFDLTLNIGSKNIIQNPFVADSLYTGLPLSTTQVILESTLEKYFPITRRFVFLTRLKGGRIFNKNLFLNELFRLGGLKTLRGHNENSFFASTYVVSTLESRWFFDRESYFFIFYDQGFLQRDVINDFMNDYPLGAGLGISFSVKAGIFNLVYALGRSDTQELGIGRSKVHFGLISRF